MLVSQISMKKNRFIYPLVALNIILVIAVVMLYQQNKTYKSITRELIIKNDSILSVNLQLMNVKPLAQEETVLPKKKKANKRS